jgi:hypothetical protein
LQQVKLLQRRKHVRACACAATGTLNPPTASGAGEFNNAPLLPSYVI